jgi:hypothetical protein
MIPNTLFEEELIRFTAEQKDARFLRILGLRADSGRQ